MNPSKLTIRGHTVKLFKPQRRTNIRKFNFANSVVENCNKLPADIENCHNVKSGHCVTEKHAGPDAVRINTCHTKMSVIDYAFFGFFG